MDFKNKYLKYKKKYLELKKQLGGVANVTAPNKIDDIYIQLWNNKDKEAFDNIVVDGKVDKKEYDENISKYFNLEVINFKNLNDDVYKSKIDSIFEFSDLNNDNRLTDNEVFSLSKRIRDKERLRIQSKDELKLEYKALNKIMGMEHIIPKGGTDREFKGIPGPDEDFSKKDTEKNSVDSNESDKSELPSPPSEIVLDSDEDSNEESVVKVAKTNNIILPDNN